MLNSAFRTSAACLSLLLLELLCPGITSPKRNLCEGIVTLRHCDLAIGESQRLVNGAPQSCFAGPKGPSHRGISVLVRSGTVLEIFFGRVLEQSRKTRLIVVLLTNSNYPFSEVRSGIGLVSGLRIASSTLNTFYGNRSLQPHTPKQNAARLKSLRPAGFDTATCCIIFRDCVCE